MHKVTILHRVLDEYRNASGPLTDREVVARVNLFLSTSIIPRISEALKEGHIARAGKKVCPFTGRQVRTCRPRLSLVHSEESKVQIDKEQWVGHKLEIAGGAEVEILDVKKYPGNVLLHMSKTGAPQFAAGCFVKFKYECFGEPVWTSKIWICEDG